MENDGPCAADGEEYEEEYEDDAEDEDEDEEGDGAEKASTSFEEEV